MRNKPEGVPTLNNLETNPDEIIGNVEVSKKEIPMTSEGLEKIKTEGSKEKKLELSPKEQEVLAEEGIADKEEEITRLSESIANTKTKLNEVRKKLGLPPSEEESPSTLSMRERLEKLRVEQESSEKQKEKNNPGIKKRWEHIRQISGENIEKIFKNLDIDTIEQRNLLNTEGSRLKEQARISIAMPTFGFMGFLREGRFRSNSEGGGILSTGKLQRFLSRFLGEERKQLKAEKKMGIIPKMTKEDPPIIYGALYDEEKPDGTVIYGQFRCFLKKDRTRSRTIFTYGDSFGPKGREWNTDFPIVWDEAIKARAAMNLNDDEYKGSYVEAQIMGGVTMEDIEEIHIPEGAIEELSYYNISEVLDEVSKRFPSVKIKVVPMGM